MLRGQVPHPESVISEIAGKPLVSIGGTQFVGVVALKLAGGRITNLELRLERVDDRWPGDQRLLQTYQQYSDAALRKAMEMPRKPGLAYVTSSECGRCHQAQLENWRTTPHARAYATLLRVQRAGDPACLRCHTTGFGTEHGFVSSARTPDLANVNCQDCHRFDMAAHQRDQFKSGRTAANACTGCHTPVTDPMRNFATRIGALRCPTAASTRPAVD